MIVVVSPENIYNSNHASPFMESFRDLVQRCHLEFLERLVPVFQLALFLSLLLELLWSFLLLLVLQLVFDLGLNHSHHGIHLPLRICSKNPGQHRQSLACLTGKPALHPVRRILYSARAPWPEVGPWSRLALCAVAPEVQHYDQVGFPCRAVRWTYWSGDTNTKHGNVPKLKMSLGLLGS
jgi:hypothetical protein